MSEPVAARAEQLLAALRADDRARALQLAESDPELASGGIACAAVLGDADAVAAALASDPASATISDAHGVAPLLYACGSPLSARGEAVARCVELLLDHGADPNSYILVDPGDPHSRVPALYFACVADQPRVVRLLLERGADPNDGESIYHAAELDRKECLELLLAHGADLSGRHSHWGNTPLYFLTGYFEDGAATAAAGMRWLLEHGADPDVTSYSSEETPLHRIAERGGRESAELLLAHGADPDRPRADGRTPFVLALRTGNQAVADLLLERGADPTRASLLSTSS